MAIEGLGNGWGCKSLHAGTVTSIRILLAGADRTDVLVIVKACVGDQQYVGFVGGPDVTTALLIWRRKEQGVGLAYREDRPWEPK